MINYGERTEEVYDALGEWNISDHQAIEILLSARIGCETPPPWIILETNYMSLDTTGAWFNLGLDDAAIPLPRLRLTRPRAANLEIQDMLRDKARPRLFVEPHYQLPFVPHYKTTYYPYLLQSCLRLRVPYPKTIPASERMRLTLKAATARALDSQWRMNAKRPVTAPPSLFYWAELLQRLSPYLRDWDQLIQSLISIAKRRAVLFDRDVDETDWTAVVRVMRDSVPLWTKEILQQFAETGRWHSLRGLYPAKLIETEVKRLMENDLIYTSKGAWYLRRPKEQGSDILALIDGAIGL